MPKNECDPEDPLELVGVELPGATEEELHDMALCFAEEFVREGWNQERLMWMFKNPVYQGPYLVWKQKGDGFVQQVIQEAVQMWRPLRAFRLVEPEAEGGRHA